MNYVIEKTKKFDVHPDVYFRSGDDCFAMFPDFESAMLFNRKLNQIHNNVKFTYELENNKQLPFLDDNVDNSKEKLELSVYKKPTHFGLHNKWSSLAPTKYKINLIRSLVSRLKFAITDNCCSLSLKKLPKCCNKTSILSKLFGMLFAKA